MNRRQFLFISSEALVGGLVASTAVRRRRLRAAIVGLGRACFRLVADLVNVNGAKGQPIEIVAVCDISVNKLDTFRHAYLESLPGVGSECVFCTDYREIFWNPSVRADVVFICTPDFCHHDQALAAFEHGVDVYCEIPLAETAKRARNMLDAARRAGRTLFCPLHVSEVNTYEYVRQHIASGMLPLGRIIGFKSSRTCMHGEVKCDGQDEIARLNARRESAFSEDMKRAGYASPHEFYRWWQYRKLGIGMGVSSFLEQILVLQTFVSESAERVWVCGDVTGRDLRHRAVVMLENKKRDFLAELALVPNPSRNPCYEYEHLFGEQGAVRFERDPAKTVVEDSSFGIQVESAAQMKWREAEKNGVLGRLNDLPHVEMLDRLDILQHDQNGTPEQIAAMKKSFSGFRGERHAWLLPETVTSRDVQSGFLGWRRFHNLVLSGRTDVTSAEFAFNAQALLERIEGTATESRKSE